MNEDMEKKLDQLLADMPKREYDLDAWLAEDETAEFDRIVSEQHVPSGKTAESKQRPLWRWVAAAASILLIIGIGVTLWPKEEQPTTPLTAQKTEQPQTDQPIKLPTEKIQAAENDKQTASKPMPIEGSTVTHESTVTQEPAVTQEELNPVTIPDPNLHYAALSLTEDSVPYQDPARVDDFIAKLAEYNKVKEGKLTCSQPIDSSVVSSVYVFPDKDEINLFSRLLQVACWYDSKAPGYHLNFSQQQFFFELKDMRRQLQYRWIAERINGRILFYSTQAPIGAKESSACYQQYRDELMYQNSFNSRTKKL